MNLQFDRHFTLDEANAMVPHVRKLFAEVQTLMTQDAPPAIPTSYSTNGNGRVNGNGNGNGHSKPGHTDYREWSPEKRKEAAYRLLNALQEQGIVIQDVERGLIDFPTIRNGEEVFLCYELNDGDLIGYFHDLHSGYAGRQKLSE